MAWVLRMPEVAANATSAVLAEWAVPDDGSFVVGDTIATVETDKALVDVEAETDGVVVRTLVPSGSQVEVGAPIAVLGERAESIPDLESLLADLGVAVSDGVEAAPRREVPEVDPSSGAPVAEEAEPAVPSAAVPPQTPAQTPATAPVPARDGRIFSSPLARRLAQDAGLALEDLTGTGPRNRILRRDVDAAVAARRERPTGPVAAETPVASSSAPVGDQVAAAARDVPHSRLRLAVASRLQESKREAPHFYLRSTVRAEALLALRAEVNEGALERGGVRISVNDLVLKAVAVAHRRVPEMNVVWTPDAVRTHETVDVAVAVATDRGLLTPVVRDVGGLSLTAVAARVQQLAGRAREGRLKQEELEGGSISVSNLGMYGVEEFAAIINPPHAAILAVGAVREEPVVEHGAVVPGKVMTVTASIDHRPVDGVIGARWLAVLTELLEHPVRMLV